jgi:precorrin-2/cobalt-factor-2 C20-methyltransferase
VLARHARGHPRDGRDGAAGLCLLRGPEGRRRRLRRDARRAHLRAGGEGARRRRDRRRRGRRPRHEAGARPAGRGRGHQHGAAPHDRARGGGRAPPRGLRGRAQNHDLRARGRGDRPKDLQSPARHRGRDLHPRHERHRPPHERAGARRHDRGRAARARGARRAGGHPDPRQLRRGISAADGPAGAHPARDDLELLRRQPGSGRGRGLRDGAHRGAPGQAREAGGRRHEHALAHGRLPRRDLHGARGAGGRGSEDAARAHGKPDLGRLPRDPGRRGAAGGRHGDDPAEGAGAPGRAGGPPARGRRDLQPRIRAARRDGRGTKNLERVEAAAMKYGILYGVSVGPGDPELMTVKAVRILERCPVVAAPRTAGEKTLALDIASGAADLTGKTILNLEFAMTRDPAELAASHRAAADTLENELREGRDVAMLNLGDVSVYSTFAYMMELLRADGFESVMIPGVPSFCAVAAALGTGLTEMNEPLHILPAGGMAVDEALRLPGTKVLMKTGRAMPAGETQDVRCALV